MPPIELPRRVANDRVVVRPPEEADIPAYVQAFVDDPGLGTQVGLPQDPDEERVRAWRARAGESLAAGTFVELAIADPDDDRFLGVVVAREFDWRSRRCEIGLWLVAGARGQGRGAAAVELVLAWLFDELGLERVEMTTLPENEGIHRLGERLGFVREGVLRGRNLERGRRVDVAFLGLLRDDWRARAAIH